LESVYLTGRLRPPPFTELSYTFRAISASYLIPISFLAAEPSWTAAQGTMPSATFGRPTDAQPFYPMPLTTAIRHWLQSCV